jgi:membrane-bound serine protease (ClpP class)
LVAAAGHLLTAAEARAARGLSKLRLTALAALFIAVASPVRAAEGPVVVVRLDGLVQPISAEYVVRGIRYANEHSASAVLLELNTPGGLDSSMRQMIQNILSSHVPVIGYVAPSGARAASAGFFVLLSCDIAAMAPGTNTGAAHPVIMGGPQPDAVMAEKLANDASAYLRSITGQRHRNSTIAETGIRQSKSFTETEALQQNLIDIVAVSPAVLLHQLNGRTITRFDGRKQTLELASAPLEDYRMTLRERILDMDPSLAFILLVAGVLCLGVEFTHPGVVVPGVVGAIALVLALFVLSFLPINWAAAGLLILSFALLVLEAKFPQHGILAAGGIVAMVIGAMLLIDSPIPEMRVRTTVALGVALPLAAITVFLLRLVLRAHRSKVMTGKEGLIGEQGVVKAAIAQGSEGMVLVEGDLWRARSTQALAAGERIRVTNVQGLVLDVQPLHPRDGSKLESTEATTHAERSS